MTKTFITGTAIAAVLIAAVGGYRAGTGTWPHLKSSSPVTSMDNPAVASDSHAGSHSGDDAAMTSVTTETPATTLPAAPSAKSEPAKLLYYRNPMGLPDTSPTPKKDEMGMDYIPVYADEESGSGSSSTVKINLDKLQRSGVRTEPARMTKLTKPVRVPGTAKPDERGLRIITLRADGFIEKLYANEHGKHVKKGEPLFRVYSQPMLRALIDYRLGSKERGEQGPELLSSLQKLRNYEVPQAAIDDARQSNEVAMSFDWPSPVTGYIMEKKVVEGQMAKMGEELFLLADLSKVWVIADVPEQDFASVKVGAPAKVRFRALPDETFDGKITFILHELDHGARSAKARIEVANPDHRIRHEMYAEVEIATGAGDAERLAVPSSAVIDSGNRQVVLIDRGEGRFEPRAVKVGVRGDGMVEITDGIKAGDNVVVSANFLIDAESNLKAALSSFTAGDAKMEMSQ